VWTLVVMGHGRWPYLQRALAALDDVVGLDFFDRKVGAFDGAAPPPQIHAVFDSAWYSMSRRGLTANMGTAFAQLDPHDEWVFWLEEDFVVADAPLREMAATLEANPDVANMVLARQPWAPHEVWGVMRSIPGLTVEDGWSRHDAGFWLNPMVSHADLLRSLDPGVETHLTAQCRERGLTFGYWGTPDDAPRCLHIGAEGGMGSPGWMA